MIPPTCLRCAGPLRPPGFWSSAWQCDRHGEVLPFHVAPVPTLPALERLAAQAKSPVWLPHPLPNGWIVSGIGGAGDDRTGACATVVALSGPSPRGGPADVVLVAEEPGVGLGARFAGLASTDPGACPDSAPDLKIEAAGHPTALWRTARGDDRTAYVGEAKAVWLWLVAWPEEAAAVLDRVELYDFRSSRHPEMELVFGAQTPRLAAVPNGSPATPH